jgi:putative FmdB family regulatory protein
MPVYEFYCDECELVVEKILPIRSRDEDMECVTCSTPLVRIFSPTTMHVWDTDRKFPHQTGDPSGGEMGEMSFPSKAAYEANLKRLGIVEVDHGGTKRRDKVHGTKVKVYG